LANTKIKLQDTMTGVREHWAAHNNYNFGRIELLFTTVNILYLYSQDFQLVLEIQHKQNDT